MEERAGERRDIGYRLGPLPTSASSKQEENTSSKKLVLTRLETGCHVDNSGLARSDNKFSNWDMHFISTTAAEQTIGGNKQFVSRARTRNERGEGYSI
jgi:hypothetical protein